LYELDISKIDVAKLRALPVAEQIKVANAIRKLRPPSFAEFFEKTSHYKLENWQRKLSERLEKLTYQKGQRIRIHKPPQHGGSILLSQRLPAYLIGRNPETAIRLVTYNETHSERFGKVARDIIRSNTYKRMFPSVQIPNNASASEWSTLKRTSFADGRSSFKGLGLQTGIVGTGGNLWIIDDPYKSREEAFSTTINEKIWWTWTEDIAVRLAPDDNVIVMYHTYNENDFTAKLKEQGGWEDIRLPAICDAENDFVGRKIGEALSPRYPIEYLTKVRDGFKDENGNQVAGIGDATFESLYQGNPKPRGGIIFTEDLFHYVEEYSKEQDSFFVRYWDLSSSDSDKADYTASTLIHKTPGGIFTVIDTMRGKYSPNKRNEVIFNTCQNDLDVYGKIGTVLTFVEQPPGAGKEMVDSVVKVCAQFGVRPDSVSRDKISRADPLRVQMEAGNLRFLLGDELQRKRIRELRDEMLSFPNGKNDDMVDSCSGATLKSAEIRFL